MSEEERICKSDSHDDHDRDCYPVRNPERAFTKARSRSRSVPPDVDGQAKQGCPSDRVGDQGDHDGRDTLYSPDKPLARVVSPGQLGLVDTLPLDLECRDESQGDDEHQGIISRNSCTFHGMHEIARLGRDDEELEGGYEYGETQRKNGPDDKGFDGNRDASPDVRHEAGNKVTDHGSPRNSQDRDEIEDDTHEPDEQHLLEHGFQKTARQCQQEDQEKIGDEERYGG